MGLASFSASCWSVRQGKVLKNWERKRVDIALIPGFIKNLKYK